MHEDPYAEPEDWSAKKSRTKNTKAQRIASPRITNNAKEEIRKMQRKREEDEIRRQQEEDAATKKQVDLQDKFAEWRQRDLEVFRKRAQNSQEMPELEGKARPAQTFPPLGSASAPNTFRLRRHAAVEARLQSLDAEDADKELREDLEQERLRLDRMQRQRVQVDSYRKEKADAARFHQEADQRFDEMRREEASRRQEEQKRLNEEKKQRVKEWKDVREKEQKQKDRAVRRAEAKASKERKKITAEYLVKRHLWNEGLGDPSELYSDRKLEGPELVLVNSHSEKSELHHADSLHLLPDGTATFTAARKTIVLGAQYRPPMPREGPRTAAEVKSWPHAGVRCGTWALCVRGEMLCCVNMGVPAPAQVNIELSGSSNGWIRYRDEEGAEHVATTGDPTKSQLQQLVTSEEAFLGIIPHEPLLEDGQYEFGQWKISVAAWDGKKARGTKDTPRNGRDEDAPPFDTAKKASKPRPSVHNEADIAAKNVAHMASESKANLEPGGKSGSESGPQSELAPVATKAPEEEQQPAAPDVPNAEEAAAAEGEQYSAETAAEVP